MTNEEAAKQEPVMTGLIDFLSDKIETTLGMIAEKYGHIYTYTLFIKRHEPPMPNDMSSMVTNEEPAEVMKMLDNFFKHELKKAN